MSVAATASDNHFIQGRNVPVNGQGCDTCSYPDGSEDRAVWTKAWDGVGAGGEGDGGQDKNDPAANI